MADVEWMREALVQAKEAERTGEVPIGAVVVADDTLLVGAFNRTIADRDPTAHAEIIALRAAAQAAGNHRLVGATLYVTVEPCIMCAGAIVQARLARVVFGCLDPKAGALGSVYDIARDNRLHHRFYVDGGIEEAECRELIQRFFAERR